MHPGRGSSHDARPMKYKTFRNLLVAGGISAAAGVVGLVVAFKGSGGGASPAVASTAPGTTSIATSAVAPTAATAAAARDGLRDMDREIMARAGQGISGDKVKDAFPSKPYKVNLFRDPGEKRVNRAKIDLDRDEKWDEKWTFETDNAAEVVKRQVAPEDDENYTEEYRLVAGRWVAKRK